MEQNTEDCNDTNYRIVKSGEEQIKERCDTVTHMALYYSNK